MPLEWTVALLVVAAIGLGLSLWQDRRPYVPGRVWIVPHHAIMFICLLALVLAAAHLVSLLTGVPLAGRSGF